MDQYSHRDNVVVNGFPSSVKKREMEDVLVKKDIQFHESDTEVCHRLGKSPKTVIRFVRIFLLTKKIWAKWHKKGKLTEIGFPETVKLFGRPNLSLCNDEIRFNCNPGETDIFIVLGLCLDQYKIIHNLFNSWIDKKDLTEWNSRA